MKKLLLIILLLCFTSLGFTATNEEHLQNIIKCKQETKKLAQAQRNKGYITFGFHIAMSGLGLYYATPYSVVCGVYFLIKSSDDLAEIKGYK